MLNTQNSNTSPDTASAMVSPHHSSRSRGEGAVAAVTITTPPNSRGDGGATSPGMAMQSPGRALSSPGRAMSSPGSPAAGMARVRSSGAVLRDAVEDAGASIRVPQNLFRPHGLNTASQLATPRSPRENGSTLRSPEPLAGVRRDGRPADPPSGWFESGFVRLRSPEVSVTVGGRSVGMATRVSTREAFLQQRAVSPLTGWKPAEVPHLASGSLSAREFTLQGHAPATPPEAAVVVPE